MIYNEPVFFEHNRVWRCYSGGKLLDFFAGGDFGDSMYPEEWIASSVKAKNPVSCGPKEGVSKILGTDIYLDDLIKLYPSEILGDRKEIGILVKLLDSAIRLPVQAHPDKAFSRKYFNSEHGKEECWIVLDTRKDACIYFGFKSGVTREEFEKAVEKSEADKKAMENLIVRHEVKTGDVILVPARCVHAIGAGCMILEVQEPSDFTIQPERWCGDYRLSDSEMYMGLDKADALKCFDYTPVDNVKSVVRVIFENENIKHEELIGDGAENFSIYCTALSNGEYLLRMPCSVCIVTCGEGEITAEGYSKKVAAGDYFLIPYAAAEKFTLKGDITLVECIAK